MICGSFGSVKSSPLCLTSNRPTAVAVKAPQHELGVRAVAGSNPSHFVGMKLKSIIMAY